MADLAAIRNALAATIQANTVLPGGQQLTCFGTLQGQINPPTAIVSPQSGQSIAFDTLDGSDTYFMRVELFVSYTEDASSQALLDVMLSTAEAGSVISAITLNPRLGGVAHYAVVRTAHSYGLKEWAGQQYFGAELLVDVAV